MTVSSDDGLIAPGRNGAGLRNNGTTAAVIITTFNHARFIAEAITSVLAQTRPADEIVVVDDGSSDHPERVLAQFPSVKLIRRDNGGPSAARNTGIQHCTSAYITFLDADDRLLPVALESGLLCARARPECAFVYGGYRYISESGKAIGSDRFNPLEGNAHLALLHSNKIVMHATVLYRRDCVLAVNGFDEAWRRGEDYDIYLRLAQRYPIASHPETIAEYRRHGQNVSDAHFKMLRSVLGVLSGHEAHISLDAPTLAALQEGRITRRKHYVSEALAAAHARWDTQHDIGAFVKTYIQGFRWSPVLTLRTLLGSIGRRASKSLPRPIVRWMEWCRGRPYSRY